MPGQGRLGDKARASLDIHGCPGCPHPTVGPSIVGSTDVSVNGRPALRVGDAGIHAPCCGRNDWSAMQGSPSVRINGKAAFRLGDPSQHCGGPGALIEASLNVFADGPGTPTPQPKPSQHTQADLDAIMADLARYGIVLDDQSSKSIEKKYAIYKAIQDGVHATAEGLARVPPAMPAGDVSRFKRFTAQSSPLTIHLLHGTSPNANGSAMETTAVNKNQTGPYKGKSIYEINIYSDGYGMLQGNGNGGASITQYLVAHELCHVMIYQHQGDGRLIGSGAVISEQPVAPSYSDNPWANPFYSQKGKGDRGRSLTPGFNNWTVADDNGNIDTNYVESSAEMLNLALWTGTGDKTLGYKTDNQEGADYYNAMQTMLQDWDQTDPALPDP